MNFGQKELACKYRGIFRPLGQLGNTKKGQVYSKYIIIKKICNLLHPHPGENECI